MASSSESTLEAFYRSVIVARYGVPAEQCGPDRDAVVLLFTIGEVSASRVHTLMLSGIADSPQRHSATPDAQSLAHDNFRDLITICTVVRVEEMKFHAYQYTCYTT